MPTLHRGEIPRVVGTVVPHVIEGVPADQANSRPPRALPFGYTEDDLPLGLTLEGINLGLTISIAVMFGGVTAMGIAAVLRRTPLMAPLPLEVEVLDSGTRFPFQPSAEERVVVLHSASEVVLPIDPATLPPVPHTSMAHAVPVADVTADLDGVSTELEERSGDLGRPAPVRLPIPIESVHATDARAHPDLSSSDRRAEARERLGRIARQVTQWAIEKGRASRERLAALPRESWNDFDRRRSPFRDGGEFWVQGAALTRIGAPEDAERHYWNGFYQCERREWAVEAAECLRCLAALARARGDIAEARAHLEAAAATFDERRERDRLRGVRREIDELPADPPARANDYLSRDELPAAADRA